MQRWSEGEPIFPMLTWTNGLRHLTVLHVDLVDGWALGCNGLLVIDESLDQLLDKTLMSMEREPKPEILKTLQTSAGKARSHEETATGALYPL